MIALISDLSLVFTLYNYIPLLINLICLVSKHSCTDEALPTMVANKKMLEAAHRKWLHVSWHDKIADKI